MAFGHALDPSAQSANLGKQVLVVFRAASLSAAFWFWGAVRSPTAGGSFWLHHDVVLNSPHAGATVEATDVVGVGRGAGAIPLRKLPCGCG